MLENLIVPTLTRYDLLHRLLTSISFPIRHVLIIDNGGKLTTSQLPAMPMVQKLTMLNMPSNLGVAGSWNLGVKSFPHAPYWAFASDDAFFKPGTLSIMSQTKPMDMLMSQQPPHWQVFSVGEEVIRRVGLWCEGYHPAYFEDNDFTNRAMRQGIILQQRLAVGHINSSTLHGSDRFQARNSETFKENQRLYMERSNAPADDAGQWDLDRRRRLEWVQ